MGALALVYDSDDKYMEICDYLSANHGYWIKNDVWLGSADAFVERGICVKDTIKACVIADFSTFSQERLKNEAKYFILKQLSEEVFTAYGCYGNYVRAIRNLGKAVKKHVGNSFIDIDPNEIVMDDMNVSDTEKKKFKEIKYRVVGYIRDFHDEKEELDKDKWHALLIPGVKLSAAIKRNNPCICFE